MLKAMSALGAASVAVERERVLHVAPGSWSASRDRWLCGGSALAALLIVALGFASGPLPEWADVADVSGTLFRTDLDRAELRTRPVRYSVTPLVAYAAGVALCSVGATVFWRGLAYCTLHHCVRQEIGWLRVPRAKSPARGSLFDARLDDLARLSEARLWRADDTRRLPAQRRALGFSLAKEIRS
jgi:hypothetical protein